MWVANVFFKSGLVKIQSWESTVALFTYEYSVPYLSPELAAYFGAFTELFFPVLLAIGLAGRLSAGVLFVFNIVA
ncbi:MAG: DoxX family protein, partial [Gammaproteobacteria bacterium]